MVDATWLVLAIMRLALFGVALGLTVISFQAYRRSPSDRLQTAFIGFAFLSMGTALSTLTIQVDDLVVLFQIAETVPFLIGFSMIYVSLYK